MQVVYNAETGAESIFVYNETVYKVDFNKHILPGMFTELRFEANRDLTNAELDHLHSLVRYHWDNTVGGLPLDDMFCDGYNAYSTSTKINGFGEDISLAEAQWRGLNFISTLNVLISLGTPQDGEGKRQIAPLPDTTVTVWASEVYKNL